MKKSTLKIFLISFSVACILASLTTENIFAQPSLNIFTGYGMSSYENVISQADYLPVGAQLMFGVPIFNFGIEANYAAIPFIFNVKEDQTAKKLKEIKFNQLFIGSVVKINFAEGNFIPFGRIGGGLYTGKEIVKWTEDEKKTAIENGTTLQDYKVPLRNTVGFNIGGGFDFVIDKYSGFFFEYVYHMVSRKENIQNGNSFKANNWVIQAGYKINFL